MYLGTWKTFPEQKNMTLDNIRYQNLMGSLPSENSEYGKLLSCHENTRVTKRVKDTMFLEFTY